MRKCHVVSELELRLILGIPSDEFSEILKEKDWQVVPKPTFAGQNKWILEDVFDWLDAKHEDRQKSKRRRGLYRR